MVRRFLLPLLLVAALLLPRWATAHDLFPGFLELEASGPVSLAPALGGITSGGVGAALGGGDAPAPTAPGASPGGGFRYAGV